MGGGLILASVLALGDATRCFCLWDHLPSLQERMRATRRSPGSSQTLPIKVATRSGQSQGIYPRSVPGSLHPSFAPVSTTFSPIAKGVFGGGEGLYVLPQERDVSRGSRIPAFYQFGSPVPTPANTSSLFTFKDYLGGSQPSL